MVIAPCWYCGTTRPGRRIREHQIPRLRGGPSTADNLVPACIGCNQRKGNRTVHEFRQAFGAAHVFYGETHVINPPPRYWTLPFSATCERCGAESPLVLSIWDLRLEGWEEDVLSHVWFCRSCAPIATEERIRAVRDMFVEAELHRWLDERFDLCGC